MNQLKILVLSAICSALAACSDNTSPELARQLEAETKESSANYQKPGAAIRFDHNYDGRTGPGETENLTLVFADGYDAGTLSVTLDSDDGLLYSLNSASDFDLGSSDRHQMEISLSAQSPGRYYLRIFAEVLLPDGQIDRRVFGLALEVGDLQNRERVKAETETGFRGDELIMLPAEENQKK